MMNHLLKTALLTVAFVGATSHILLAQEEFDDEESKKVVPIDKRYQNEVNAMVKLPAVQAAFKRFAELEPQTKKTLITLTEIPAPPFNEEARAKAYAAMLKEAGADSVWIDEVNNVLAKKKGKRPPSPARKRLSSKRTWIPFFPPEPM